MVRVSVGVSLLGLELGLGCPCQRTSEKKDEDGVLQPTGRAGACCL